MIHAQQSLKVNELLTLLRTKEGELYVAHGSLKEPVPVPASPLENLLLRTIREAVGV